MTLLTLPDKVPLRTTAVWGEFAELGALPWVWGRRDIQPVPYDRTGRWYLVADHVCAGLDRVERAGVVTTAPRLTNTTDRTGHAVALLDLGTPLRLGESLRVWVRGRLHPRTGALITNPADLLWDLLANLCGLDIQPARLDDFRAECAAAGLEASGVLSDSSQTVRSALDDICNSVGAIWSLRRQGIARLYPPEW